MQKVCLKSLQVDAADDINRRHFQMQFSWRVVKPQLNQSNLGVLRVKIILIAYGYSSALPWLGGSIEYPVATVLCRNHHPSIPVTKTYRILHNYRTYPYKRTVKQFRLQPVYFLSTYL